MAAILQHPAAYGATPEDWAHFDMVLGLTADLLPVVSNPKATISAKSAMRDLGKVPSFYNDQRQAIGFTGWTHHESTAADIARWSRERDYGISLQTRRVRAIDVDITDAQNAADVWSDIYAELGEDVPHRSRSNSVKFLVAFEMGGEFTKRKITCAHGIIEFLATGQQFIAVGTHPSGVRYAWSGDELPDVFPVVPAAQFERLWAVLVDKYAVVPEHASSPSVKAQKLADVIAHDAVAKFLIDTNRVKRSERDGRLHIACPFEAEHTGESSDSATTYFPAHTGGYVNGHFQCLHAHCEHRNDQEFLDAIGYANPDLASEFSTIADVGSSAVQDQPASARGEVADSKPEQRFTFIPAHEFAVGTPPAWMVKGVLPQAVLGVIYGESGSGKTFMALDLACAVATGVQWRDRVVARKGRVAYIVAEGAGGFRNRLKAVAQQRNVPLEDIPLFVLGDAPNMMEKQDALDVAKAIVRAGGADLVVVDTFAQVMPGANENAGEDVGRALAHCKGIHRATGALVLLVHHSGKDASRGARGWSGLRAAADVELEVVRADDARSVSVTKMKDGEDGAEFGFRLDNIVVGMDDEGEEITSCIVRHEEGTGAARRMRGAPRGNVERVVLNVIAELSGVANEPVAHFELKNAARNQLPHDASSGRDRRGERIERAFESLIAGGFLQVDGTNLRLKSQEIAG